MGLPFRSGHVLSLRRWTASSVGESFTSIWHRDPGGRWAFHESAPCEVACTRYFGDSVQRRRLAAIRLEWETPHRLRVRTGDANPLRVWYVTDSHAVVEGQELGPIGPLPEQAHMADFYFPQRGIFAAGRVYLTQPQ